MARSKKYADAATTDGFSEKAFETTENHETMRSRHTWLEAKLDTGLSLDGL